MVIYPLIIFIYISKIIKTSFIDQENNKNKLNINNSKSNLFVNKLIIGKNNISNYNDNLYLEVEKVNQRKIEEKPNDNENKTEDENALIFILKYLLRELHKNLNTTNEEDYKKLEELLDIFIDKRIKMFHLNPNCFNLINSSYNAIIDENELPRKEFLNELLLNLFINKNDFISFDKCLQKSELFHKLTEGNETSNFHPFYFFSLANKLNNNSYLTELKKSTLLEKNYFYYGICLIEPGNVNDNDKYCNETDYLMLIKLIQNFEYSINETTFETFRLKNKNDYFSKNEIFVDMIPFLILLIPSIIRIISLLCKKKKNKKQKKGTIIPLNKDNNNPLDSSDEDNDITLLHSSIREISENNINFLLGYWKQVNDKII